MTTLAKKGCIQLKLRGGVVTRLKDARCVPVIKKNIISLKILEAKGYKFNAKNGTLKVYYREMVVLTCT